MPRLIVLNGPPGVGKSTVAAMYGADHPGTLVCDIDLLRGFVSGWEADYLGAGARIRPSALAMIAAYLRDGGDVVLPQLLAREQELDRFVAAGVDGGAAVVEVLLTADVECCVRRFAARDLGTPQARAARAAVDATGGDSVVRQYHATLSELAANRPWTRVIDTGAGDIGATYSAVLAVMSG